MLRNVRTMMGGNDRAVSTHPRTSKESSSGRRGRRSVRPWFGYLVVAAVASFAAACGGGGGNLPAGSLPTSTTSVSPTSAEAAPPVSTSVPPVTDAPTTQAPATTAPSTTTVPTTEVPTTEVPTTAVPVPSSTATTVTTTTPATGTTTTPSSVPAATQTTSTPWGWIIAGIVIAVAIITGLVLLLLARSRREAMAAWVAQARPAYDHATLTRTLLLSDAAHDPGSRQSVHAEVDRVTTELQTVADSAPNPEAQRATTSVAEALRGLAFAGEAERLMYEAVPGPTGEQLAQADQSRRTQVAQLDTALAALQRQLVA